MTELIMYFAIGFLVAAFLGLLFIPLVHNRAVQLTSCGLCGRRKPSSLPATLCLEGE